MGHRNGSGLGELPVSGHASNSDQHPERAFFPNLLAQTTHFQNLGVSQQPLARAQISSVILNGKKVICATRPKP